MIGIGVQRIAVADGAAALGKLGVGGWRGLREGAAASDGGAVGTLGGPAVAAGTLGDGAGVLATCGDGLGSVAWRKI